LGTIADSIVFWDADTSKFLILGLIPFDSYFLAWGSVYQTGDLNTPFSLRLIRLSYEFELLHDTILYNPDGMYAVGNMSKNARGNLVVPGLFIKPDHTIDKWNCKEITADGVVVKEKSSTAILPYMGIIEIPDEHGYNVQDYNKIAQIDSSFNYVRTLYVVPSQLYPTTLFNLMTTKLVNGSKYIIEGNVLSCDHYFDCAWKEFEHGVWGNISFYGSVDTSDWMAGIDFKSDKHIYSAVNHWEAEWAQFQKTDNEMQLFSTSLDCTQNWRLYFGGLGLIHSGRPLATSDLGCLWIGNYWDWHTKSNHDYDILLLKVNQDGTLVTNINEPEMDVPVRLIQNPGSGIMFRDISYPFRLQLSDLSGRVIFRGIVDSQGDLNTLPDFPSGFYLLSVYSVKGVLLGSSKWIKN